MNKNISLRRYLHQHPELSNKEYETSKHISEFMEGFSPDRILRIGETGRAFVFDSGKSGITLVFRAELDALPIVEQNHLEYISENPGIAHACGHDGHMAILAGLAQKIDQNRPQSGKVVLLFQPAEELEQGAMDVIEDPEFERLEPDYIFALHNIPHVPMHKILIKPGYFSAASKGMTIKLKGKTAHASEPEKGTNPASAISRIIKEFKELNEDKDQFSGMAFTTIIHIELGEIAFGTSPGYAEVRATLRAFENRDLELLGDKAEQIIESITRAAKLKYEVFYSEQFPSIVNDGDCVKLIRDSAKENNIPFEYLDKPFRWSEDFGYYTEKFKGGYFGLGSGENQPALHNPDYDFPDDLIDTGVKVFFSIFKTINRGSS